MLTCVLVLLSFFSSLIGLMVRFNGWAVTVFDSLDTMWLMGLKDEFYQAMDIVEKTTFTSRQVRHSFSV